VIYNWSPTFGLSNPNIANPILTPNSTTTYTVTATTLQGCTASDQVTVFVNNGVILNAGNDVSICSGSSTQLNATGSANYVWSPSTGLNNPNIGNPIANPSVTTTYTVSSVGGCGGSDQVTVFVNNGITINAGPDKTVCAGTAAGLTATGGTNYSWSPATGLSSTTVANPSAAPAVTTTYTVTSTNGSCASSDQVTVFVNNGTRVNAGFDQTICAGTTAGLNATGGANYNWSPAIGLSSTTVANPSASPPVTTTYTVTSINGSCASSDQVTVFVNNATTINAGPDRTVCAGTAAGLIATGGTNYSWSPAIGLSSTTAANPSAAPPVTTTYTVMSTNGGCVSSDQVTVFVNNGSNANAGLDQTICNGSSVQLNATGGTTYSWSPSTGLSNPNIANPIATPSTTTIYTVTTSIGNGNSCSSTDNVVVTIGGSLAVTSNLSNPGCCNNNGRINLNVTGGTGNLSYNWSPNISTSNNATNLSAGTYRVSISDATGCQIVKIVDLIQNCNTCAAIAEEGVVCVDANMVNGEICLPVPMNDIHNYQITANGQIINPNHGCDFQNLTAYSYSLLSGAGNNGPYKIDNWTVNGVNYTGMVNNMTELTAWMNTIDPSGNWTLNTPVLIIMGGNPSTNYGNLDITHQLTWVESTLNPNTTGVAQKTLVEVPMGNADNILVTIRDIRTCCEETVLLKRCTGNKPDCEDFISNTEESYTVSNCMEQVGFCVPIPRTELGIYTIEQNGELYAGAIEKCEDGRNIKIYASAGKHVFIFTNQLTDCSDEIIIKVSCLTTGGLKPGRLDFAAFQEQRAVALQWATNTGYKNDYFLLEKSSDGRTFEAIDRIENKSLGDQTIAYNNKDEKPANGENYYRIKQVYIDGTFDYTVVKQVAFNLDLDAIGIYPNPANEELNFNLAPFAGKAATIQISNNYGQVVKSLEINRIEKDIIRLPLDNIASGFYQVFIKVEGRRLMSQKLVVEKMH